MKKLLAILAGAAAVAGSLWLLHRKKEERSVMVSGKFGEDDPIDMTDNAEEAAEQEASNEE